MNNIVDLGKSPLVLLLCVYVSYIYMINFLSYQHNIFSISAIINIEYLVFCDIIDSYIWCSYHFRRSCRRERKREIASSKTAQPSAFFQNRIHKFPSFSVCHLLRSGVAAIFGPQSAHTASHVQSICDTMEIPHLETRWDYRLRRESCLVNLYPHPTTLSKVLIDGDVSF